MPQTLLTTMWTAGWTKVIRLRLKVVKMLAQGLNPCQNSHNVVLL